MMMIVGIYAALSVFLLLLSAPYRTKSARQSSRRKPLGRTVP
jgi:hypothetical protein